VTVFTSLLAPVLLVFWLNGDLHQVPFNSMDDCTNGMARLTADIFRSHTVRMTCVETGL
jgi:hypothetical protein